MIYENGKTYTISHTRKGKFDLRVESQDEEWLHGYVAAGTANAILECNIKEAGDKITVRRCLVRAAVLAA